MQRLARFTGVRFASVTKFTKSHEYIKVEGNVGTVGITDFAQKALGDVVFVGLPDVGASFKKGCVCLLCTAHGQSSCAAYAHSCSDLGATLLL